MLRKLALSLWTASGIALASGALGAPPPGPPSPYTGWFQGLHQPGTGMLCCSIADCRHVRYRIKGGHYEALIEAGVFDGTTPGWLQVPDRLVLHQANPTGEAVLCVFHGTPMCFVPEAAT